MTVKVKICGITSPEQALMAQRAGADALGLVIYPKSSRYVDIQRAAEIRAVIAPETMAVVLLVNADKAAVKQVIDEVKPDLLQFHGDETPAFCQQFGFPFIRAIRMREGLDLDAEVVAFMLREVSCLMPGPMINTVAPVISLPGAGCQPRGTIS